MTSRFPTSRFKKVGYTTVAGLGLFLGAAGLAAAATGGGNDPSPAPPAVVVPAADHQADTVSDEANDGVDHQFEGEEVGENGNGIPDANEANENEADETASLANGIVTQTDGSTEVSDSETDEVGDEANDGVDHQFEGDEVGENGNGIPDANEADENEADEDEGGINCENGIDTATGNDCDGGPAAAQADEASEAPDNEADD